MSTVREIEKAVSQLSTEELAAFRAWFVKFDAQVWDEQIEKDVAAGHLDELMDEAIRELHAGRCVDL